VKDVAVQYIAKAQSKTGDRCGSAFVSAKHCQLSNDNSTG